MNASFPPWRKQAWIPIVAAAIFVSVGILVARGDLSTKTLMLALIGVPVGALIGYLNWGFWENLGSGVGPQQPSEPYDTSDVGQPSDDER
jgi:hypothetical protein